MTAWGVRPQEGLSLGAYSILVSGYANLAMIDQAERWFNEMQQALPPLRNDSTSPSTTTTSGDKYTSSIPWTVYYVMLKACVELRSWAPAERVLATMTALKFQSQVPKLTVLIREVEKERAKRVQS